MPTNPGTPDDPPPPPTGPPPVPTEHVVSFLTWWRDQLPATTPWPAILDMQIGALTSSGSST